MHMKMHKTITNLKRRQISQQQQQQQKQKNER